jgi:hypothetical protein
MPKGRAEDARIGLGEYEYPGSSVDELRARFLMQVQLDVPQALEALRTLDGSEQALDAWAAHWHLRDAWIVDVARRTLQEWRRWPALATHLQWADVIQTGELVPEPPAAPRWLPTVQTEQEFRASVEEYILKVRTGATAQGLTASPVKPNFLRDVRALVDYQVKGRTRGTVAAEWFGAKGANKRRATDAARKALASLATKIGLTLRK